MNKKQARQYRVIELLAQGKGYGDIARELGVSRVTIWNDRKDIGELPIVDELINIQLREIDKSSVEALRLKYRGELIRCLRPQKMEAKTTGEVVIRVIKPE